MDYAISVVFQTQGYWSKPYTYKSSKELKKGDIVIVPTGNFFSVGKVTECSDDQTKFKPNIAYKNVLQIVDIAGEL